MKKIICKVEYDTELASVVHQYTQGNFGDPTGYEETLMQMPGGAYFVYTNGGAQSKYPCEKLQRIAKNKVAAWIEDHTRSY